MNYCQNQPQKPLERVNGYNIKVGIKSKDGTAMSALGFQVEFWVEGCGRKVVIGKCDMVDITQLNKATEYFAQFYDYELGNPNGWVMATVAIQQPDENWPSGFRDVTIENVFTGVYLGHKCSRLPRVPNHCVCNGKQWVNGFKVEFEKVDYLPKGIEEDEEIPTPDEPTPDNPVQPENPVTILYGVVRGLNSFGALTESQVEQLVVLDRKPSGALHIPVTVGDTLVVLCDGAIAYKGDGIGGKTAFDTSIMGANGDTVMIGGKVYRAYGETFLVSGTIEVYIV